ncbi:MAG: hypothetical protein E7383_02675 [Ruminococcaceae bacterium]|nr:hypothetical protein [Oscillospiraceae bacterium]
MYNKQKNSIEYSEPVIEQYSDNVVLEVMPQKNDDETSSKYVLIKHDYYSSDSDHGREMLKSIFNALAHSEFKSLIIYLVDKGTLLLDNNNPLFDIFQMLISKSEIVIADDESITKYQISCDLDSKISIQAFSSIAEDIVFLQNVLTLE